jgi:hypothetical protein
MSDIVSKIPNSAPPPDAAEPARQGGTRRNIVITVDAETMDRQLKKATVHGGRGTAFEIWCDESAMVGGDDSAPSPLMYFSAGIAF